ncbi:ketopantoate reductase family protein [Verrucomicrobiota bacterium]
MNITIIGPGAMGCLLAGFLNDTFGSTSANSGRAEHKVWLFDKNPVRSESLARNGIRIDTDQGSRSTKVNITTDPAQIGYADTIFLCVKSYDTSAAIKLSLPIITPDTTVVSIQNGAGNAEKIVEMINAKQIVCGITEHGSTTLGEGHIRHAGEGPTSLAPFVSEEVEQASRAAELLNSAGFKTYIAGDTESMIFSKLIVNAAINPLTALSNVRNGQLLENPELRRIMSEAATEAASVVKAKGIVLTYNNVTTEVENICRATSNNISSMLQDVRAGKRTEIDSITGVIVNEAHALNIKAPTNEMLLERIKKTEREKRETRRN